VRRQGGRSCRRASSSFTQRPRVAAGNRFGSRRHSDRLGGRGRRHVGGGEHVHRPGVHVRTIWAGRGSSP
jgi:hypothetical protein